jgi:hypothetical protein
MSDTSDTTPPTKTIVVRRVDSLGDARFSATHSLEIASMVPARIGTVTASCPDSVTFPTKR